MIAPVDIYSRSEQIEARLLQVGQWGIGAMKFVGYFPYTITGKKLSWKPLSPTAIYTYLLIIGGILWNFGYHHAAPEVEKALHFHSSTEIFAQTFLSYFFTSYVVFARIQGLLSRRKFLGFWRDTVHLLTHMSLLTRDLDLLAEGSSSKPFWIRFRRLGHKMRNGFLRIISLTALHFVMTSLPQSGVHITGNLTPNLYMILVMTGWMFTSHFHPVLSLWTNFFPSIYGLCFRKIRYRINMLVSDKVKGHSAGQVEEAIKDKKFLVRKDWAQPRKPEVYHLFQKELLDCYGSKRLEDDLIRPHYYDEGATEDEALGLCIDAYLRVEAQVKNYNETFGLYLVLNTFITTMVVLIFAFFFFIWNTRESWAHSFSSLAPCFLYWGELFNSASIADEMQEEAEEILKVLNGLPFARLDESTTRKIQVLALKLVSKPPKVEPGMYFTLNKNVLASILSALTMYLIVLVQFENADAVANPRA